MTLDEYQEAARRTINSKLSEADRLLDAAMGLSEEAGEVLGLVRKRKFQLREVSRETLIEELGDILWCLSITADCLGLRLDDVASKNIDKLERRHPTGYSSRPPEDGSRTSAD
jgi:NTP pyrophosphatase (non-canonical NTP hydrolase)